MNNIRQYSTYTEMLNQALNNALDYGMSERDYWQSTPAEIERYVASRIRVMKIEAQERASYDYILADLIGKSMARLYSSAASMPEIGKVYPTLFDTEEITQKKQQAQYELSAVRFRQFAEAHNKKFQGGNKSE